MNEQPDRKFAITIDADEFLKTDAAQPIQTAPATPGSVSASYADGLEAKVEELKRQLLEADKRASTLLIQRDGIARELEARVEELRAQLAEANDAKEIAESAAYQYSTKVAGLELAAKSTEAQLAEAEKRADEKGALLVDAQERAQSAESDREALLYEQGITVERLALLPFDARTRRIIDEARVLNNAIQTCLNSALEQREAAIARAEEAEEREDNAIERAEKAEARLEQFARDIANKLDISYEPPVEKGECKYLVALEGIKADAAEARGDMEAVQRENRCLQLSIGPQTCEDHKSFSAGCLNCRLAQRDGEVVKMRKVTQAAVQWQVARDKYLRTHNIGWIDYGAVDSSTKALSTAIREYRATLAPAGEEQKQQTGENQEHFRGVTEMVAPAIEQKNLKQAATLAVLEEMSGTWDKQNRLHVQCAAQIADAVLRVVRQETEKTP